MLDRDPSRDFVDGQTDRRVAVVAVDLGMTAAGCVDVLASIFPTYQCPHVPPTPLMHCA